MSGRNVGAQQLLDNKASFSGWMKKYVEKTFTKSYCHRYCVLHNGNLYYFHDHNSKSPCGMLALASYRACTFDSKDKRYSWGLMLENQGFFKKRLYYFMAASKREQMEWIKFINAEIQNIFLNHVNLSQGDGDEGLSEEEYDDVKNFQCHEIADCLAAEIKICEVKLKPLHIHPILDTSFTKFVFSNDVQIVDESPPKLPRRPTFTMKDSSSESLSKQVTEDKQIEEYEKNYIELYDVGDENVKLDWNLCGNTTSNDEAEQFYRNDQLRCAEITTINNTLPPCAYQWLATRERAEEMLKLASVYGMYLLRRNKENKTVLTVFCEVGKEFRHFIVFNKENFFFLSPNPEPKFTKLADLIVYYGSNDLPNSNVQLTVPYG